MKNVFILVSLFLFATLVSCVDGSKKTIKTIENQIDEPSNVVQVLSHPLVFEDLDFKIGYFSSVEVKPNSFELSIALEPNKDFKKYTKNHFIFIHGFDFDSEEFLNMDTNSISVEDNQIIFKRILKTDVYDFREIRFGLVDKINKKRYFTRTIKSSTIKN